MQTELKKLQESLGITFIYITHDQEEALNMSDRIILMREGEVLQTGTPGQIYEKPQTAYAARFVGEANIISGIASRTVSDNVRVAVGGTEMPALAGDVPIKEGSVIRMAVRRENIIFGEEEGIPARVTDKLFAGGQTRITFETLSEPQSITAVVHGINPPVNRGDITNVSWRGQDARIVL